MAPMRWLLLAGLGLTGLGCDKKPESEPVHPATAPAAVGGTQVALAAPASNDTLLIGEIGSLTGGQATFGISTKQGIEMAVNEANAAGGVAVSCHRARIARRSDRDWTGRDVPEKGGSGCHDGAPAVQSSGVRCLSRGPAGLLLHRRFHRARHQRPPRIHD